MNAFSIRRATPQIGRNRLADIFAAVFATMGLFVATYAWAQTPHESQHGAHEVFVSPDAAIVWAVLKAPSATATNSDKADVWLRIVNTTKKFTHVSIDGVDPFSKKRERVQQGIPLQAEARIQSDRDTFSDLPSREVHFYRSEADLRTEKPALTVYYLGVPDQTPEFSTRAALDNYLTSAKLVAHPVDSKPR